MTDKKSPAEIYAGLRNLVFGRRAPDAGPQGLRAVLMDVAMANGVATIVAFWDGTVSLYTSKGGGMLGLGGYPGPRQAGTRLIEFAPEFIKSCTATDAYPLPTAGMTRFYLVGADLVVTAEANSQDLAQGRHELSPLFAKCNELLTEVTKVQNEVRAKRVQGPPVQ